VASNLNAEEDARKNRVSNFASSSTFSRLMWSNGLSWWREFFLVLGCRVHWVYHI